MNGQEGLAETEDKKRTWGQTTLINVHPRAAHAPRATRAVLSLLAQSNCQIVVTNECMKEARI